MNVKDVPESDGEGAGAPLRPSIRSDLSADKARRASALRRHRRTGSIAIIERFWRTLEELIDSRFMPPLSLGHLGEKVELAIFYYAILRPHQGLDGATPAEMYFGSKTPAKASATPPPPANAREPSASDALPFELAWCDGNRRMPFLLPVAA